jgi:predicted protein tyrosine phosphatase
MNIMICSANDAAHQLRVQPHHWYVVSLRCRTEDRPEFKKVARLSHLARAMLVRRFDDIWVPEKGRVMPSREDIKIIIDWVRTEYPRDLMVHCYAGVSRSSAVAYVLACIEKDPAEAINMLNPMIHSPNERIVELGADILNKPEIVEAYEKAFGDDPFSNMMGI